MSIGNNLNKNLLTFVEAKIMQNAACLKSNLQ